MCSVTPPGKRPSTYCTGGLVDSRAGQYDCGKFRPHWDSIPETSIALQVTLITTLCQHTCTLYTIFHIRHKSDQVPSRWMLRENPISFLPDISLFIRRIEVFFLSFFLSFLVLISVSISCKYRVHFCIDATRRTHSLRQDFYGWGIGPSQRPLPNNKQHSKERDSHVPAEFESTIPTSEQPQTHTATGIGTSWSQNTLSTFPKPNAARTKTRPSATEIQ